jgi:hypothetical protein
MPTIGEPTRAIRATDQGEEERATSQTGPASGISAATG